MSSTLIVGIILALVGFIVYITRAWTNADNKKATRAEEARVANDRNYVLEREKLENEAYLRKREEDEIAHYRHDGPAGTVLFYPRMPEDKDPGDIN